MAKKKAQTYVDWQGFQAIALVGQSLLLTGIGIVLVQGNWSGALTLAAFLVFTFIFIRCNRWLPSLFNCLLVLAVLLNAAGWTWQLFKVPGPNDELTHAFTIFCLTLGLGFLAQGFLKITSQCYSKLLLFLVVSSFGIAIGGLWEIVEWTADKILPANIVKGLDDTITDLIVDSLGAMVAGGITMVSFNKQVTKTGGLLKANNYQDLNDLSG